VGGGQLGSIKQNTVFDAIKAIKGSGGVCGLQSCLGIDNSQIPSSLHKQCNRKNGEQKSW